MLISVVLLLEHQLRKSKAVDFSVSMTSFCLYLLRTWCYAISSPNELYDVVQYKAN